MIIGSKVMEECEAIVKLPIWIGQPGDHFLACCPALDIMSQGATRDEAKKNLIEAIGLFVRSCIERGTLRDALIGNE